MARIETDAIIDQRYRVISRVGSGGMADVFCAEDLQLGRKVALKLLHERFTADEEFVERFRREASSAAGLQHPNVVQVYDRGEWNDTYYIAMEYLEGTPLNEVIRQEGPIPADRAIEITLQILTAARFAHKRGVIHRDIKPHNVIIDSEDRVKVTDFGIARAGASDVTETGSIVGTAKYLSPEQAQGQTVGGQSDLYSIGIVLYELLTGQVPFDADSAVSVALKHVSEQPPSPRAVNPTVSPELDAIVLRTLAKHPGERFANADEFISALELVYDPTSVTPPPGYFLPAQTTTTVMSDQPRPPGAGGLPPETGEDEDHPKRRWGLIGAIAAVVVAAVLLGGYLLWLAPEKVEVPNVVGRTSDVAAQMLRNQGLEVNINIVASATVPNGRVATQSPQPGGQVKKGATVSVDVSSGPGVATIPVVEGLSQRKAADKLRDAGFQVRVRPEQSDTIRSGKAIGTEPGANLQLERGQTVALLISSGPTTVVVPGLTGLTQSEAENSLQGLGLKSEVTLTESGDAPGTVVSQNPKAQAEIQKGSIVSLTVTQEPAAVTVPNVTGKTVDVAVNELSGADFGVKTIALDVPTQEQNGLVLSQDPVGGSSAAKGTRITITVGRYSPTGN